MESKRAATRASKSKVLPDKSSASSPSKAAKPETDSPAKQVKSGSQPNLVPPGQQPPPLQQDAEAGTGHVPTGVNDEQQDQDQDAKGDEEEPQSSDGAAPDEGVADHKSNKDSTPPEGEPSDSEHSSSDSQDSQDDSEEDDDSDDDNSDSDGSSSTDSNPPKPTKLKKKGSGGGGGGGSSKRTAKKTSKKRTAKKQSLRKRAKSQKRNKNTFRKTPFDKNRTTVYNYGEKEDRLVYTEATKPIYLYTKERYNLTAGRTLSWLDHITDRVHTCNIGVVEVEVTNRRGKTKEYNILASHAQLPMEDIENFVKTFVGTESRDAQEDIMFYHMIKNSITEQVLVTMSMESYIYILTDSQGEEHTSGLIFLKLCLLNSVVLARHSCRNSGFRILPFLTFQGRSQNSGTNSGHSRISVVFPESMLKAWSSDIARKPA